MLRNGLSGFKPRVQCGLTNLSQRHFMPYLIQGFACKLKLRACSAADRSMRVVLYSALALMIMI